MKTSLSLLLSCFIIFNYNTVAQVVISQTDMPDFGKIYKSKVRNNLGSNFDYETTDTSYVWDVSDISFSNTQNDTFVKVSATPLIYSIYFSSNSDTARKATIATPSTLSLPAPGFTINDVFFFYRETSARFAEVGFGATINDIQIPVKYSSPDYWYRFPITFGSVDTSYSAFNLNIPTYGYLGETKMRINTVDGWGTLKTHRGTFPVIRIKSELFIEDTIYVTDFDQGYKFSREEIEYKWLSANTGVPLLMVADRMGTVSAQVFDSVFVNTTSVSEVHGSVSALVYPNPASDYVVVSLRTEKRIPLKIRLTSTAGHVVYSKTYEQVNNVLLDRINLKEAHIAKGFYLLSVETSEGITVCPLVVN